jgi:hypothetical protein
MEALRGFELALRPKAIPEHMSGLAFGLRVSHWQLTPSGGERAVSVLMFG